MQDCNSIKLKYLTIGLCIGCWRQKPYSSTCFRQKHSLRTKKTIVLAKPWVYWLLIQINHHFPLLVATVIYICWVSLSFIGKLASSAERKAHMSIQGSGCESFQIVTATDVCFSTGPSDFLAPFSCLVSHVATHQDGIPRARRLFNVIICGGQLFASNNGPLSIGLNC